MTWCAKRKNSLFFKRTTQHVLTPAHDLECKRKRRGNCEPVCSKCLDFYNLLQQLNQDIVKAKKHSLPHLIQERICRCLLRIPNISNALFWLLPSTLITRLQVALPTSTSKFAFVPPAAHTHTFLSFCAEELCGTQFQTQYDCML